MDVREIPTMERKIFSSTKHQKTTEQASDTSKGKWTGEIHSTADGKFTTLLSICHETVSTTQSLQSRSKWNCPQRNLTIGDVVLVKEDGAHRGDWPLGRVTEAMESDDGKVRKAQAHLDSFLTSRLHQTVFCRALRLSPKIMLLV